MRDKVGAEQLQHVPSLVNLVPVGCPGRPGPPWSVQTHAVAAATGTVARGLGTAGLRC